MNYKAFVRKRDFTLYISVDIFGRTWKNELIP